MNLSLFAACSDEPTRTATRSSRESAEHKVYCPGVGQVLEEQTDEGGERIELIEVAEP